MVSSAASRLCSFLKGRTTAREARCQLRYRCFLILVLFSACFLSLQGWESMDWSLVPARKRTFNFWPAARRMKDVSMDGTAGTKARLMPCSGSAVHAPEVLQHVRHPRMQRALGRKFLAFWQAPEDFHVWVNQSFSFKKSSSCLFICSFFCRFRLSRILLFSLIVSSSSLSF